MLSVSDARKFSTDSSSQQLFKTWWEVLLDYLVLGLLIATLIAWTSVFSAEASGIICILFDSDSSDFGYVDSRYVNSRCAQEMQARVILYYPYIQFVGWILLFVVQKGWLKIPAVSTKMEAYYKIFNEMCGMSPIFRKNDAFLQMLPDLDFDNENRKKLKVLHDKLMFLLAKKGCLRRIYKAKLVCLLMLTLAVFTGLLFWCSMIDFGRADFPCSIGDNEIHAEKYKNLSCTFGSAYLLYGVMLLDASIVFLMFILNGVGLNWLLNKRDVNLKDIFGGKQEYYNGLLGCPDLKFCISLIETNIHDGSVMFEVIKLCLKSQMEQHPSHRSSALNANTCSLKPQLTQGITTFEEEYPIVKWIAGHLGFKLIAFKFDSDHLFKCLNHIRESLPRIKLNWTSNIRHELANEIQRYPLHFKTLIDNDENLIDFDTFLNEMIQNDHFGTRYAVEAAANLFRANIAVIAYKTTGINEINCPIIPEMVCQTRFLGFVTPCFYFATDYSSPRAQYDIVVVNRRTRYAMDERYRKELRQTALRCTQNSKYN